MPFYIFYFSYDFAYDTVSRKIFISSYHYFKCIDFHKTIEHETKVDVKKFWASYGNESIHVI